MSQNHIYAIADYDDHYVKPIILSSLALRLPGGSYTLLDSVSKRIAQDGPLLQFRSYESIDFDLGLSVPKSLFNAYIIRKGLIRKHYLSNTVSHWVTKHPASVLHQHFKPTLDFEIDYAEFLDDALLEAYELHDSFKRNESKHPASREWWILKPGMSDRGEGIRLFSTLEELQSIFESWEAEQADSDEEENNDDSPQDPANDETISNGHDDRIITSHLRHFIVQPYIDPPLLVASEPFSKRKFHIRTYIVAAGALRVYVFRSMLALFASLPYKPPWECFSDPGKMRNRTLTNTCIQSASTEGPTMEFPPENVFLFHKLDIAEHEKERIVSQIQDTISELFRAALAQATSFQPLPNSFEIFGVDFLVDADLTPWLLEVNAFPDFAQTGDELKEVVIQGLFDEVVDCIIAPHFELRQTHDTERSIRLQKVLDIDIGRS